MTSEPDIQPRVGPRINYWKWSR